MLHERRLRALDAIEGAMKRVEDVVNVGWKHMLDNYSEFAITAGGTFIVHEVLYFAAWIPWLILDLVPGARRCEVQPPGGWQLAGGRCRAKGWEALLPHAAWMGPGPGDTRVPPPFLYPNCALTACAGVSPAPPM